MTARPVKTLVVVTGALLKFRVTADRWEQTTAGQAGMAIRAYRGNDPGTAVLVAEFADVHAVYEEDKCELVTAEED